MEKIDKITYDTPVKVIFNGSEAQAKIDTIGYEITDEKLPVNISLPMKLYPGTPVKLVFTLEIKEAGMYVPSEAVFLMARNIMYISKPKMNRKKLPLL